MDSHIKDQVTNDWCDVLCKYTLQEVRDGIADVFDAAGGKLRSINEYQVQEAIKKNRSKEFQSLPKQAAPEPERKPATKEEAAQALRDAGFEIDENGRITEERAKARGIL